MNAERRRQIEQLFQEAVSLPAGAHGVPDPRMRR
jgi:hypothetical protein